ncbi:DUF4124 domain-containing protein [Zhongshania guokunii]|uniref:DUF4124 domain-containing protein n=1 Tax=Zhongshania guokunii TaxID=641783 RepID=A0ABV3U8N7_9GAMM
MARYLLLICSMLLSSLSFATEIYRSTDQYGNTVFSDKAPKNSTPVKLPPTNTTPATDVSNRPNHRPTSINVSPDNRITIQSPNNGAIIANGLIATTVSTSTQNPLDPSQRIVFSLDNDTLTRSSSTQYTIPRLSRGPHRIGASIIDEHGRQISKDAVDIMVYLPGN